MDQHETRLLTIEGRVQGVGYRVWLERRANAAGLDGWVRNRRDGSVEALVHGSEQAVRALIHACRDGPALAHVTRVDARPAAQPPEAGFKVRPTA